MANGYCGLGFVLAARGELDAADEMWRKSLEVCEKHGRAAGIVGCAHLNLGLSASSRKQWTAACEHFSLAVSAYEQCNIHRCNYARKLLLELELYLENPLK